MPSSYMENECQGIRDWKGSQEKSIGPLWSLEFEEVQWYLVFPCYSWDWEKRDSNDQTLSL